MAGEADLSPHPWALTHILMPLLRALVWLPLQLLGPMKVRGAYRVPSQGGVLILGNHIADLDPPVVQYGCKRPLHFMAKSELFAIPVVGSMLRLWKAFPVKRGEPDRVALRRAADLLKAGEAVSIFPEGQLSEDGELQPLKPGIALIIRMAQCPVICCGIKGTNLILPYGKVLPRPAFKTVELIWGEPHTFAQNATTEEIMIWVEGQLRLLTS